MSSPKTIKDLLAGGHISMGNVRLIAKGLFCADNDDMASDCFPAPYNVRLPSFDDLPAHVQGFIIKGILEAEVEPTFRNKSDWSLGDNRCNYDKYADESGEN